MGEVSEDVEVGPDGVKRYSRRLLGGAAVAAATGMAALVAASDDAGASSTGQLMSLGQENDESATTSVVLAGASTPQPALVLLNEGAGTTAPAPYAGNSALSVASSDVGVAGSGGSGAGVVGWSPSVSGVIGGIGTSPPDPSVSAQVIAGVLGSDGPWAGTVSADVLQSGVAGLGVDDPGVLGWSTAAQGVHGHIGSQAPPPSVAAQFVAGVLGSDGPFAGTLSADVMRSGVAGLSVDDPGVLGWSTSAPGVVGSTGADSPAGGPAVVVPAGVVGVSAPVATTLTAELSSGVFAAAGDPAAVGLQAVHTGGGLAVNVVGRIGLASSGIGVIPGLSITHVVADASITSTSRIFVALNSDPNPGILRWVQPTVGVGFTIHMSPSCKQSVSFSYLVVEGASTP